MVLRPKGVTEAHLRAANIGEDYWECDFQNFIGPESAKETSKDYLRSLESNTDKGIGLLFGGPPGPGKTTLAAIILKYLSRAGWTTYMISLGEIIEDIQRDFGGEDRSVGVLSECRDADYLLIDDVGKEHKGPTGFSSTIFDNLIRHRSQHRLPTFITTNLNKSQIKDRYGTALLSLIEGKCKVVEVNGEDVRRTRLKA